MSVVEKLIMTRFFGRKQGMPELVSWMLNQVCAEDSLLWNILPRYLDRIFLNLKSDCHSDFTVC